MTSMHTFWDDDVHWTCQPVHRQKEMQIALKLVDAKVTTTTFFKLQMQLTFEKLGRGLETIID